MIKDLQVKLQSINKVYSEVYALLTDIPPWVAGADQTDRVDAALLLREIEKRLDDLRKECARYKGVVEKVACIVWMSDPDPDDKIRGVFATATPDMKAAPNIPKRGTPEYHDLCEHFGLDDEVIDSDLFRIHWPTLSEVVTELQEDGLPLPPGCDMDKTNVVYRLLMRKRPNVDLTPREPA